VLSLDGAVVVVVAAAAGGAAVALGGWGLRARSPRRSTPSAAFGAGAAILIVVLAVAAVPIGPPVAVFSILVGLNQLLGRGENVPFSTYPMFSRPEQRSWSVRLEDAAGEIVGTPAFGMIPSAMRKRFATDVEAALAAGQDPRHARAVAADRLAEVLERRRPRIGRLATEPVTIVLMDYQFDGTALHRERTPLTVSTPT
jgi:hypothetical protein